MTDINEWSFEECKSWLINPINEPDPETDDVFDRAFYKEVMNRYNFLKNRASGRISDFDFVSLYPSAMKTEIKV